MLDARAPEDQRVDMVVAVPALGLGRAWSERSRQGPTTDWTLWKVFLLWPMLAILAGHHLPLARERDLLLEADLPLDEELGLTPLVMGLDFVLQLLFLCF